MPRTQRAPSRAKPTPRQTRAAGTSSKADRDKMARLVGKMEVDRDRRQENRDRFIGVIYGKTRADGRVLPGRLASLRKAFKYLGQAANRDHYEFTHQQASTLLTEIDFEVQKFRQLLQANAKTD